MVLLTCTFLLLLTFSTKAERFDEGNGANVIYKWTTLEYEWTENDDRQKFIENGSFIIENNIIAGIKVYRNRVYVTVPRWKEGIPSTLNEVVKIGNNKQILRPFPNWNMQKVGNCDAFQYVQSMEVDPNTGYMWIIDTGRTNTFSVSGGTSRCRPKIVIIDIVTRQILRKHIFSEDVVSRSNNFLNDLVLDYVNGKARFAYISDAGKNPKMIVYDIDENKSYFFQHSSMTPSGHATIAVERNISLNLSVPIDGIAMSPDFQYVYYCTLADKNLHRIPTEILRTKGNFNNSVQFVGKKIAYSGGIIFSQKALYYGDLQNNMVYRHPYKNVQRVTTFERDQQPLFNQSHESLEWVDTLSIDNDGNLWFVTNKLVRFFTGKMNFSESSGPNMYIWKVVIDEPGYLWNATIRTDQSNSASRQAVPYTFVWLKVFICGMFVLLYN